MRKIIKKTIRSFENIMENLMIRYKKHNEFVKFKDKRRKQIYQGVVFSKEQEKEIQNFWKTNYGKKVSLIWHRHYFAFTHNYDPKIFPEYLFIPEFERFMNLDAPYALVYEDKYILSLLAKDICQTPKNVLICSDGLLIDPEINTNITVDNAIQKLKGKGKFFFKPTVESGSGKGCQIIEINNQDSIARQEFEKFTYSTSGNFAIQELIQCSDSVKKLNPTSVNTFRIISYRWRDTIITGPAIMRLGRNGKFLDNAHQGGMFIGINENGFLCKEAFTEFGERFEQHPDTGIVFDGYHVKNFPLVLETVKKVHGMLPQVGCVNWDFTISKDEKPILIEANVNNGSIWLPEIAWGKGFFGENTSAVLKWLSAMEKLSSSERKKFRFGYMPE